MTTETQRKDLAGLGIAVTGAAGDLGGAMALELAGRGAVVTMLDRVRQPWPAWPSAPTPACCCCSSAACS